MFRKWLGMVVILLMALPGHTAGQGRPVSNIAGHSAAVDGAGNARDVGLVEGRAAGHLTPQAQADSGPEFNAVQQQSGFTVSGTVKDGITQAPLQGACIWLHYPPGDQNYGGALTDTSGAYSITAPEGAYHLKTSKSGYAGYAKQVVVAGNLTENVVLLPSCTVTVSVSSAGTAVYGALVILQPASGQGYAGITDSSGSASSITVPAGAYSLKAEKAGYLSYSRQVVVSGNQSESVVLQPQPGFTVSGQVTSGGVAVAGVEVKLYRQADGQTCATATTDSSGSYSASVPAGTYWLKAYLAGWTPQTKQVVVTGNLTENVSLQSAGCFTVSGVVKDGRTGVAIYGAQVSVTDRTSGQQQSIQTDRYGAFSLPNIPAGACQLKVSRWGYVTHWEQLTLTANMTKDVGLQPAATISGVVRDSATQAPLKDASVSIYFSGSYTDSTGAFYIAVPPGTYQLRAGRQGYVSYGEQVTVSGNVTRDVLMKQTLTISGIVKDNSTLAALVGVKVTLSSYGTEYSGLTDARGAYSFQAVPTDECWLSAAKESYVPHKEKVTLEHIRAASGLTRDMFLQRGLFVSGVVKDSATQAPIREAKVRVYVPSNGLDYSVVTEASGAYSLTVPAGVCWLDASRTGYVSYRRQLSVSGNMTSDVALQAHFVVSGFVRDNLTRAPLAVSVELQGAYGGGRYVSYGNSTGGYSLAVPPGIYWLSASAEGYKPHVRQLAVAGSMVEDVSLRPVASYTVTGVVTCAGAPLAGAVVKLGPAYSVVADANGAYRLTVRRGVYSVEVSRTGYVTYKGQVTVYDDVTRDVGLEPGFTLWGVATSTVGGSPLKNVSVYLEDSSSAGSRGRDYYDTGGAYAFAGIAPGVYLVYLLTTDGGYAKQVVVSGHTSESVSVAPAPRFTVSGTVTSGGAPLAGVEVRVIPLRSYESSYYDAPPTDASGAYSVPAVPGGACWLQASKSGYVLYREQITIAGSTSKAIALQPGFTVSGVVTDSGTRAPLDGVRVWLYDPATGAGYDAPPAGSDYGSGTTGSDGGYTITVPAGSYQLMATRTGYLSCTRPVAVAGNLTQNIFLQKPATFAVSGVVTAAGSGTPLADVSVSLLGPDREQRYEAGINITGGEGAYLISGVPAGTYQLFAYRAGYASFSEKVTVAGDLARNIALQPVFVLSGLVTSAATGIVLSGSHSYIYAYDAVTGQFYQARQTTDTVGPYSIVLPAIAPARTYTLRAAPYPAVWLLYTKQIAVGGNMTENISLQPSAYCTVSGKVTSAGAPVSGVYVSRGSYEGVSVTDSAGNYSVTLVQGDYWLTASKSGYVSFAEKTSVTGNLVKNIVLEPGFTVSGTIGGASPAYGSPAVSSSGDGVWLHNVVSGRVYKPSSSTYRGYAIVVPAGTYDLHAEKSGYSPYVKRVAVTGNLTETITLQPAGDSTLRGVVRAVGASVSGVRLSLSRQLTGGQLQLFMSVESGANGFYCFAGVPAGTYWVRAYTLGVPPAPAPGDSAYQLPYMPSAYVSHKEQITVSGDTTRDIDLKTGLVVYCVVKDAVTGAAVQSAKVALSDVATGDLYESSSGSGGAYPVVVPAGAYELKVTKTGYTSYTKQLLVNRETTELVSLQSSQPQTGFTVSGVVTAGAGGTPLAGVSVALYDRTTKEYYRGASTDSSGAYSITNVALGTHDLKVNKWPYIPYAKMVTVSGNLTENIALEMGFTVSGMVTVAGSSPTAISSATVVTLRAASGQAYEGYLDVDGGYSISVPAGPYELKVSKSGYLPYSKQVTVNGNLAAQDIVLQPGPGVVLRLVPSSSRVVIGSTFTVRIQVEAGQQPVAALDAFVNFDPALLEVIDVTPNLTRLSVVLHLVKDNVNGRVDYSAGVQMTEPSPTSTFTVATITFKSKVESASTSISFNESAPRPTMAAYQGNIVTGALVGCSVSQVHDVPLRLQLDTAAVVKGQEFGVALQVACPSGQQVSTADAFISFDPTYLEVKAVAPDQTRLAAKGSPLVDNTNGRIDYSASKAAGQPYPAGSFTLATVTFRARETVASTPITLSLASPRRSTVAFDAAPVYGAHSDVQVSAAPSGKFAATVTLEGGLRPQSGFYVPLTLRMYSQTTVLDFNNVLTAPPLQSFSTSDGTISITDANMSTRAVTFEFPAVAPGTYNVALSSPHCLINLRNGAAVEEGALLNMGTLLEGNADDDVQIAAGDFSMLLADYLQTSAGPRWNGGRCDFDRNGQVAAIDFSLLALNYNKTSPQVVVGG